MKQNKCFNAKNAIQKFIGILLAEFRNTGAYQDNQFELEILGETVPFVLDEELRKDNYKRHFEICDRIMDLLREQKLI